MWVPDGIRKIRNIETEGNVLQTFSYDDTTSWIDIKNKLTTSMYSKKVRLPTENKNAVFSLFSLSLISKSIVNYVKYSLVSARKDVFLGASTGVFLHKSSTLDSYFPYYDASPDDVIYMLNCGNLVKFREFESYLDENSIVIENYLISPLKLMGSIIVSLIVFVTKYRKFKNFSLVCMRHGVQINVRDIVVIHSKFIVGYHLYKLFFGVLKIKNAYIISPTTKSDMCAALQSLSVRVKEIQHGVVGEMHRGYNFKLKSDHRLPVADEINVYNQFWKDEIVSAGYYPPESINIVGRLRYDLVNKDIQNNIGRYVVFTGQGAFLNEIVEFISGSADALDSGGLIMVYKPHPRETKAEIDFVKINTNKYDNVIVYEGELTTEQLIVLSVAHVSIFSSCHFDAIHFKNKSYVLDVMEDNIMKYYASRYPKKFVLCSSVEDLIADLNK